MKKFTLSNNYSLQYNFDSHAKNLPIIDLITKPYPPNMNELADSLEEFECSLSNGELVELDGIVYKVVLVPGLEYPRYQPL
jgi:hypothetical protein